jgi:hypothetical protein
LDGKLFIDELVVALETASPGKNPILKPDQLASKVQSSVDYFIVPIQRQTLEHKQAVRKRITNDTVPKKLPLGRTCEPRAFQCSSLVWQNTFADPDFFEERPKSKQKRQLQEKTFEGQHGRESPPVSPLMSPREVVGPVQSPEAAMLEAFQDYKLDLNAFTPHDDRMKLPPSRQRPKKLPPPAWAEKSHKKLSKLLNGRREDLSEFGEVIIDNISDYYMHAGQTISGDLEILEQSATSPYQNWKRLRAAQKLGAGEA